MGDKVKIVTKGEKVPAVEYTDVNGITVSILNIKNVQTYRTTSPDGSADKVSLTLVPDELEWEVEFGET